MENYKNYTEYTINNNEILNNSISDLLNQTDNLDGEELLEYLENQSKEVVDILLQFNINNILNKLRSIFLTTVFRFKGKTSHSNDVPRPLNAYMIYRKRNLHLILDQHKKIKTQNEVNIIIGKVWKNEKESIKNEYKSKAEIHKLIHSYLFPNYKFKNTKGKNKYKYNKYSLKTVLKTKESQSKMLERKIKLHKNLITKLKTKK
ncbi:hypothetical protein U3516DRAFT_849222 [Neocallimastix sp. 'constans']